MDIIHTILKTEFKDGLVIILAVFRVYLGHGTCNRVRKANENKTT